MPQGGEKEAGAAGGESDARSHGPALGGEAGSVLMGKLNRKVLPYATTSVVFATNPVAYPPQAPVAASATRITTYAEGSEKGLSQDLATLR